MPDSGHRTYPPSYGPPPTPEPPVRLPYPGAVTRSLISLVADILAILVFVVIGLLQHAGSLALASVLFVAWPFALGLLMGHLAIRSWRAPLAVWPHGVLIWAITVAGGMAIRTLFGAGTEPSFVIVTAAVLALLMLGWRAIARLLARRSDRERSSARA